MFSTLTFNMQNGQPWVGDSANPEVDQVDRVDLDGTLAFLRAQDADVIFLQEVERGHEGGRQEEPPPHYNRLREGLSGYEGIFGYPAPNPQELPFGLGLAIFSKTALRDVHRLNLPAPDVRFEFGGTVRAPSKRLLIGAATDVEGRTVQVLNTHLQAFFMIQTSSNAHRAQRDLVEAELRRVDKMGGPALLAGDFNSGPDENVVGQFAEAGFHTSQNSAVTWRRRPYVLDHIFYNAALRLEDCRVVPTEASDHHAVRSEFSFAE